jgi:hypothetical protein
MIFLINIIIKINKNEKYSYLMKKNIINFIENIKLQNIKIH